MASNGTGFSGRSAATFVDDSSDGFSPLRNVARVQRVRPVVGDSEVARVWAGAAPARTGREIDHSWRDSMQVHDRAVSQRRAELSHARGKTATRQSLRLAAVALLVGLAAVMVGVQPAGAAGPRHGVIEGLFDVGGYDLYLRCTGTGTPTVVMDASANADSSTWSDVEPSLARVTRVCVYDRAGLGRSDPPTVLSPARARRWSTSSPPCCDVAAVPGPYVLVGHSIAGFNVQLWAREDGGHTVVGVVLIDATPTGLIAVYDSLGIPIPPPDDLVENEEGFDYRVSATQIRDGRAVPARTPRRAHPRQPGSLGRPWRRSGRSCKWRSHSSRPRGASSSLVSPVTSSRTISRGSSFGPSCRSSPGPDTTLLTATPSAPPTDGSQLRRAKTVARSLAAGGTIGVADPTGPFTRPTWRQEDRCARPAPNLKTHRPADDRRLRIRADRW